VPVSLRFVTWNTVAAAGGSGTVIPAACKTLREGRLAR